MEIMKPHFVVIEEGDGERKFASFIEDVETGLFHSSVTMKVKDDEGIPEQWNRLIATTLLNIAPFKKAKAVSIYDAIARG